ncbi:archaeosortase/exosortase family protein [Mucilaginibacter sp. CSA2-8R]|uniref:archaeosortase/exosortase family protein n=1 Tax=Mucilaginibacter sp. CSA2-8R TaxID=3141542 RepID=UPI00315C9E85
MKLTVSTVKQQVLEVPKPLRVFILRAFLCLLAWNVVHNKLLSANNDLDAFFSSTLAGSTSFLLNIFSMHHVSTSGMENGWITLFFNNSPILNISNACNGLDVTALYIAFICCIPSSTKRMVSYIIPGVVGLFAFNVVRCIILSFLGYHQYSGFEFFHHYVFTTLIYGIILFVWISYLKASFTHETQKA